MEKYVQEIRLKQWCELIETANSSGLPRKQWLKENGISRDAFLLLAAESPAILCRTERYDSAGCKYGKSKSCGSSAGTASISHGSDTRSSSLKN